jgi:hypothetical protein
MSGRRKVLLAAVIALVALAVGVWLAFGSSTPKDKDHAQDCWSLSYAAAHGGRRHCAT